MNGWIHSDLLMIAITSGKFATAVTVTYDCRSTACHRSFLVLAWPLPPPSDCCEGARLLASTKAGTAEGMAAGFCMLCSSRSRTQMYKQSTALPEISCYTCHI